MADKKDQFSDMNRKGLEAAMKVAQLSFDNAQRIMALQSDLAKEMFQSSMESTKAQAAATDPQALMQLRAQHAQLMTQRMASTAQKIAEVGNAAREELTRMFSDQAGSGSPDMMAQMQAFMKNVPGQNPQVMDAFNQSMATANAAFAQMTKASESAMKAAAPKAAKPTGSKRK